MIKPPLILLFTLVASMLSAQNIIEENTAWRKKQNAEFRDSTQSPLKDIDRKNFDSLAFYPINETFYIIASVTQTPDSVPFKMKTSTDRLADYRQWGIAHFEIDSQKFDLPVYQNLRLLSLPNYKDYLFIPFTDLTNGEETYGAGRYVEATLPEGDTLLIDFNKAYNPYCAYNDKYSCPIPPKENHLGIEIKAGELVFEKH
ncbi:Protein of unknown function (DUF1684) [Owenweeksia hongkongensis DSM 17368]|uniref:DUF1684 domain-containing protein n=1 Tax=Owenweeksia hongkongensis (strain DSM 17368 / CIP 108786 / JCM 12287 / NRRL B-23963 / UST20020801) TaxID=926562 RepID=G8QZ67_OWEHD|nr:DUF1684 domain-containing protein [Owenweeksia hongkongensis]AEV31450.1 Protein of unknown function (DUF1684) [Owenweeksia hongkongensis DSM 17368]